MPSSAAARTARSRRSTISGARPSESSSTSSSAALAGEAAGQREHLLLATRQQADAAVEVRFELGEQRQRTIEVAPADAQVLARREVHQHGSLLRHHAEPLPRAHVQRRVGARRRATAPRRRARAARPRASRSSWSCRRRSARAARPPRPRRRGGGGRARSRPSRTRRRGRRPRGTAVMRRPSRCRPVAGSSTSFGAEVRLDHARVVADRVGRALRDRVPEVERDDAIAGLQDQRHVVLDDEHADPAPRAPVARIARPSSADSLVSRPAAGSSSRSTAGSVTSARAMPTRRATPCDNDDGRTSSTSPSCELLDDLVHERGRRRAPGPEQVGEVAPPRLVVRRDEQVLAHRHLLEQLDRLPRPHDAGAGPPLDRPAVDRRRRRNGPIRSTASVKPVTTSRIVVLPAPFGPMSPTTSPGSIAKLTPSTATTPPNFTTRSVTASVAARRRSRGGADGRVGDRSRERAALRRRGAAGPTVPRPAGARATTAPRCRRAPGAAPRSRRDPTARRATTRCRCPTGRSSRRRRCRARWARRSR